MASPRVERRLAAILAADIVGYSRLVEQDEAGTLAAIRELRARAIDPLLAEHHGRIVKLMGDGAIVEFGSVVDAVACAVAVQKAVSVNQGGVPADRRIVFRIGVNLGDVVVEGDDLLGDGVNVAARLEQLCQAGGVMVSGTAYDHLQGRLGLPLEFAGEQRVKNIARPVRAYRVRLDGRSPRARPQVARRMLLGVLALCIMIVGVAAARWWVTVKDAPAPSDEKPSIAVLQFQNVSDNASLDAFTEGLRADILRDMSATRVFAVLTGGGTSSGASNREPLGGEIGATYLVEGTVQTDGPTLHVAPRLVDTASGRILWSEGFERPLAEANSARAEIGRRIANALIVVPAGAAFRAAADAARVKPPTSRTANECVILSVQERFLWTKEGNARALELAQRSVELDPRSAAAQLQVAYARQQQLTAGWAQSREDAMARWLKAASAAVALDPTYAYARISLGRRYNFGLNPSRAEEEFERAAELAPGNAEVLSNVGVELGFLGRAERAVDLTQRAARMDPDNDYRAATSKALFFAGRYAEAAAEIEEITDPNDEDQAFAMLAYAQLGRAGAAQRWKERLGARQTDYIFEIWAATFGDFAPSAGAQRQMWLDGLRKLSIPICATPEQLIELKITPLPECEAERANRQAAAP